MTQTRPFLKAACLCLSQSFPHCTSSHWVLLHCAPFPWPAFALTPISSHPSNPCPLTPVLCQFLALFLSAIFSPHSFSPLYLVPDSWNLARLPVCPVPASSFCPRSSSLAFSLSPSLLHTSSVQSCPLALASYSQSPAPLPVPSRAQAGWGPGREVAPRAAPPPPPPSRAAALTFAAPCRHAGGRRRGRDDPESRGQAGPGGGHGRAAPRSSGSARRPRVARSCLSRTPAGAHAAQPHAGTRARRRPGRGRPRTQPIRARAGRTPSPHRGHRPAARAHARPGRLAPGGVGPHATRGPHCTQEASRPRSAWGCPRGRTRDAPPALSLLPMQYLAGDRSCMLLVHGLIGNSEPLAVYTTLCLPHLQD